MSLIRTVSLSRSRGPVVSPLSSVPGDLLLEIASHLDSRADVLHFSLSVRSFEMIIVVLHRVLS
jgi:hypothetical protein